MTDHDAAIAALLERAAPPARLSRDEWESIVADARGSRPRWWKLAGVPALAAAALLLALAWPFGGSSGGGFAGRALAALGDGSVLHVVRQGDWGGTLVDLATGARRELPGIDEDWYDSGRNVLRHVSRLGATVQDDTTYRPPRAPADVVGLATRYRDALQSGSLRIAARGEVDGEPVDWIVVHAENLPDVADNKLHEWTQQIAVSLSTYEPVATRETRDGNEIPDSRQRIVKLEYVSEGDAAFASPKSPVSGPFAFNPGLGNPLTLGQARAVLPGLVWPGDAVAGLRFARAGKVEYRAGFDRSTGQWAREVDGVLLAYGDVPARAVVDGGFGGAILIRETASPPLPAPPVTPPAGTAYVSRGSAFLQTHGLYVSIEAPDEAAALAAARAVSGGSAARR